MAHTTPEQRKILGRVMHEFEHGELYSGKDGSGGRVTNRQQAIAIALEEAGASKYESEAENKKHLKETERKQAKEARSRKGPTYDELYERARKADIPGRSKMSKQQLANALHQ